MEKILRAINKNQDKLQQIRNYLGKEEILAGLGEESSELAQAALKYRRALDTTNYTPVSPIAADENLQEEFADVFLLAWMAGIDTSEVAEIIYRKINRWADRLKIIA